jgi:hypothetical protein
MGFARGLFGPTLDSRKDAFNPWPVAMDRETRRGSSVFMAGSIFFQHWNQVFRTGENKHV